MGEREPQRHDRCREIGFEEQNGNPHLKVRGRQVTEKEARHLKSRRKERDECHRTEKR
jgi:hypothetical protein